MLYHVKTLFNPHSVFTLSDWHHHPLTHSKLNWSNITFIVLYDQCREKSKHYETNILNSNRADMVSGPHLITCRVSCFELLIPPCVCYFALGGRLAWYLHARTQRDHEVSAVHTTATWGLDEASANLLWSPLPCVSSDLIQCNFD